MKDLRADQVLQVPRSLGGMIGLAIRVRIALAVSRLLIVLAGLAMCLVVAGFAALVAHLNAPPAPVPHAAPAHTAPRH